jgi:hypothetical protein
MVTGGAFHECHSSGQLVQIASDLMDRRDAFSENGLQVAALDAAGQLVDPSPQPTDLHRLHHHDHEQAQTRQDEDDGRRIARDEVHNYLRLIARSLPAGSLNLLLT